MGVSVPLKLKDSAGLQSFDSDDYDFLAYRAGLQLRQSDSSDITALTRFHAGGRNVFDVGTLTNTVYDSATGTGGDTSLLSVTSISSNIYRNIGTDGEGSLETYNDSNYANLFYQTDSASQQKLVAFSDSDWNVVNNEIVSRIYKYDYVGSVRLASEVTDFDSANGGWSNILPNFFSDTRTTDSATDSDISYSIFQKIDMTGIGVPSDNAKPFTVKYRTDSAEINVAGAFKDIGRDSDFVYSKSRYYPSSPGVRSLASFNRAALTFTGFNATTQEFDSYSSLYLSLDKEWNDKIYGVWQRANGPAGRGPKDFLLKNFQQTQFSTVSNQSFLGSNYGDKIHDNASANYVYKDSAGDTASHRLGSRPQVWLGVKGRVNLVDSDRFGDSAATFAATDATMQSLVESDGKWSFLFNFDSNATFKIRGISDGIFIGGEGGSEGLTSGVTYIYDSEGVNNLTNNNLRGFADYSDVAVMRPGWNYFQFPGQFGNKGSIIPDSSTNQLISHTRTNGNYFASLFSSIPTNSNYGGIGLDSADEINLVLNNDFQGLQIADSDKLDETIGTRARNHISSDSDAIGSIKIFSATEGNPISQGYTGNWITKGTATDTRKSIVDANYTRTRVSTYTNLRTSEYTTVFSETYDRTRTSNYSVGFIGNYTGEFDRTRSSEYISNYTRNRFSTFTRSFLGNYAGNFAGNFVQNFTGDFTGNYINNDEIVRYSPSSSSLPQTGNELMTLTAETHTNQRFGWGANYTNNNREFFQNPDLNLTSNSRYYNTNGSSTYTDRVGGWLWPDNGTYNGNEHSVLFSIRAERESSGGAAVGCTIEFADDPRCDETFRVYFKADNADHGSGTYYYSISGAASGNINVNPGLYSYAGAEVEFVPGAGNTVTFYNQVRRDGGSSVSMAFITIMTGEENTNNISVDYTGTYTRNSTTTSTRDSTRTSTRTSLQDVIHQYIGDYTRSFSRNFVGNYSRNFSRTRPAFFSRDFTGNYTGDYSRNFEGNFEGNYIGNYQGNYTGAYEGGFVGNYLRNSTISSGSAYGNNPLGPPGQFYWLTDPNAFYDKIEIAWDGQFLGYSPGLNENYNSITTLYSTGIAYTTLQLNQPTYNYNTFMRGSLITTDAFGRKYYRVVKTGTYTGNYAGNYGLGNFVGEYTRTSAINSVLTSLTTRSSNFSGDYSRIRTSEYLAGENFSRTFAGNYTGDYTGNFSRNFLGNYSRNFTGDFTGEAIGTTNTTIQTYTLYVKVG